MNFYPKSLSVLVFFLNTWIFQDRFSWSGCTNLLCSLLAILEAPYVWGLWPCPFSCLMGPQHWQWCHLFPGGGTSKWFVVGEDWWTAIATPFLCEINSTCRSALYEWWRPPQVIHTAAQRHSSGPHRTYKAGIKQSLFPTGPCITDPRPHTNTPTWIHRWREKDGGNTGKLCSVSFEAFQVYLRMGLQQ